MKAIELMIGDWVLTLDSTHKEKVFAQVDAIEEGKRSILVKRECSNWFVDIDWIEPIPLTTEILEKNGFTHCLTAPCGYYNAPVYDMFDILFHISDDTYEDTWHTEVFTDHNDNNFVLFNLCFVHETQHALRLCGLNELADNFKMEECV